MQKHELQTCPACGSRFYCRMGNIGECQCFGIPLTREQGQMLKERYGRCLCAGCLSEIASGVEGTASTAEHSGVVPANGLSAKNRDLE